MLSIFLASPALLLAPALLPHQPTALRAHVRLSGAGDDSLETLLGTLLALPELAERRALMDSTVVSWPPAERKNLADSFTSLLTERAVATQTAALAAHERGEDVSAASAQLQILVDLTVNVKMAVRELENK